MANIGGKVLYDSDRAGLTGTGIANVPVALYNTTAGTGAVVLTDSSGNYLFSNVANGSYRIIETWGTTGTATPVDFGATAAVMTMPAEVEPPLSAVTGVTLPAQADLLDAVTANLLNVTMSGTDITNANFYDGPVGNKALAFTGVTPTGANLITAAENGSWGTTAAGSIRKTTSPTEPYAGVAPGFTYTNAEGPTDGTYTVINTYGTGSAWWPTSDHTTHLETGRYSIVNPSTDSQSFFTQTVTVTPNTDYLLSAWLMNLIKLVGDYTNPVVKFRISTTAGTELTSRTLGGIDETTIPIWYQNGCLFNSGANTSVKVELLSMATGGGGNDFAVDDIALYKVVIANQLTVTKQSASGTIYGGKTADFTITVQNTLGVPAANVTFQDTLNSLLTFTAGSVKVNNVAVGYEAANPNTGFSLGSIAAGASAVVKFSAAVTVANTTIQNFATATYDIMGTGNGDNAKRTITSSVINLRVKPYDYSQPFTDMAVGMALEKTALASIMNQSANAIAALVAVPGTTVTQIIALEDNLRYMLQGVQAMEGIFSQRYINLKP